MTRRGRGQGSVYFDRSRKVWTGSVEVGWDALTGKRRRRKVTAKTKTGAQAKLDALKHERYRSGTIGPRDATVAHVIRAFLESPPASWRSPVTVAVNRQHARRILRGLGRVKLADLMAADVEAFLHALASSGLSFSTIKTTRGLLASAIRRAERDGLAGRNAAALAELPRAPRRKSRALTMDQVTALLALDLSPWWRAYLMAGITLGLRPGELLGLRWRDVDFTQNVLRVRRSLKYDRAGGGLYLDELKTEQSRRTLAMTRAVAGSLRALKATQARERLAKAGGYEDQGLVFADEHGRPSWAPTVIRRFKKLIAQAGIEGNWHPHLMRHTFVSVASHAGVSIEDIADAAGHVNPTVTQAVYRHVIAEKVTRTSAAMDEIFSAENGG